MQGHLTHSPSDEVSLADMEVQRCGPHIPGSWASSMDTGRRLASL